METAERFELIVKRSTETGAPIAVRDDVLSVMVADESFVDAGTPEAVELIRMIRQQAAIGSRIRADATMENGAWFHVV